MTAATATLHDVYINKNNYRHNDWISCIFKAVKDM